MPPVSLTHGNLRFDVTSAGGVLQENISIRNKSGWTLIAKSNGKTQGALSIRSVGSAVLSGRVETVSRQSGKVVEEIAGDGWTVKKTVEGFGDGNWIHISTVLLPVQRLTLHSYADSFQTGVRPNWSFSPSVGGFIPDGQYKSPVILVQGGPNAIAIVPDLLSLDRASLKRCQHALDLDARAEPQFSVGYIPARQAYHTVFKEDLDRTWTVDDPVTNSYYMYVSGDAPPYQAFRNVVRFEWNQFGRKALPEAASEQAGTDPRYKECHLWDEWRNVVWERETRESWLISELPTERLAAP